MNDTRDFIVQHIQELTEMITKAQQHLLTSPPGTLRISQSHGSPQYYWRRSKTDSVGTYINQSNMSLVYELAQKDYVTKFLSCALKEKVQLEVSLKFLPTILSSQVYSHLSPSRQLLVDPYFLTDKLVISRWLSQKENLVKQHSRNHLNTSIEDAILTDRGERVRSKSEKILADKFHRLNIPYVYECPFLLKGYGYIYPDFTLLNVRTRKEYYWEHLGLMDRVDYVEKTLRKLESYEKNNVHEGSSLILSYETKNHPLCSLTADLKIQEFLL